MVRRSSRARQQTTSAYDEELKHLADKKNQPSQDSDSDASDVEKEVKEAMMAEDAEDELEDMEEEEEFRPGRKNKTNMRSESPRKRPKQAAQTNAKGRGAAATQGRLAKSRKSRAATGGNKSKRAIQSALNALSKKVLEESESPQNALVASLLASIKPIPGIHSATPRQTSFSSHKITPYSEQLEGIARRLLQDYEPNGMQIQLLNLLFRSIGGNVEQSIKDGTDLEDLEWNDLATRVVEVMLDSETVLLTAVPEERLGPREYRAIYKEFWYRLGVVILSHTPSAGNDDEDEFSPKTPTFSSNRFQVELMRDLVSRVTELIPVGQPDLRSGATMAIWELAAACMERTVELSSKLATAQRQYAASKGQSRKLQALQHSMDSWKRHKPELEALVEEAIIQGVFIRRYRDSNAHIRCESLQALGRLTLLRPDIFLKDTYLKYLGWMTSDKSALVRVAALKGLLAPFKHKDDKRPAGLEIELEAMQNVCTKFLPRIADCTEDAQSLDVQEIAMELIVKLMNEGFMDEWDDDEGWDQLNLKAIDANTTPAVRKNALYLVLDQLDCFDEGGNDGRSVTSSATLTERQQIVRLDAVSRWLAHHLCNGPVKINKIKVEVADYVVQSLREMPEHRSLTTSWNALLKAIRSENPQQGREEREELARTRVLLRMLACAADLEASNTKDDAKKRKRGTSVAHQPVESLSLALLKNLPGLLTAFKGDNMSLRSLTKLPQHLLPELFSLPARKAEFTGLVKNMCALYLESTDEVVLREIAKSLILFVQGDHARVPDVQMQLKRVSASLRGRLMELLAESDPDMEKSTIKSSKSRRSSKGRSSRRSGSTDSQTSESAFSSSRETNVEHSISLCLQRLRVLMKQIPLPLLFDDSDIEDEDESEIEGFCNSISEALARRLTERMPVSSEEGDQESMSGKSTVIASVWKTEDLALHSEVANTVDLGLDVILCVVGWKLAEVLEDSKQDQEDDDEVEHSMVVRLRDNLAKLVGLCYEQYLEDYPGVVYSDEQEDFSTSVQISAGRVASDLRTLFPRGWGSAKRKTLQHLSLKNDFHLIGGFVRFLQSRDEFDDPHVEIKQEKALVNDLVLPVARALTANWSDGNRKEAGVLLSHLTATGKLTGQTVAALARMLKKIQPVRFLESQMAALRMTFKAWLDAEPNEPETSQPTEDELEAYDQAERDHQAMFHSSEQLASRLSMSLGVGKLSNRRLSQALLNFMQEGIRFAFEGDVQGDDDLVLGSRLPFLIILSKYSNWFKKEKSQRDILADFIFTKESALRSHPEFNEVHEDDLGCIAIFRESLGISESKGLTATSAIQSKSKSLTPGSNTPEGLSVDSVGSRRKHSTAGSQRSRLSVQSNLSPLLESQEDNAVEESPSPQKRRRLATSLEEGDEDSDSVSMF